MEGSVCDIPRASLPKVEGFFMSVVLWIENLVLNPWFTYAAALVLVVVGIKVTNQSSILMVLVAAGVLFALSIFRTPPVSNQSFGPRALITLAISSVIGLGLCWLYGWRPSPKLDENQSSSETKALAQALQNEIENNKRANLYYVGAQFDWNSGESMVKTRIVMRNIGDRRLESGWIQVTVSYELDFLLPEQEEDLIAGKRASHKANFQINNIIEPGFNWEMPWGIPAYFVDDNEQFVSIGDRAVMYLITASQYRDAIGERESKSCRYYLAKEGLRTPHQCHWHRDK